MFGQWHTRVSGVIMGRTKPPDSVASAPDMSVAFSVEQERILHFIHLKVKG
jgi:hypothetical protein